MATTDNYKLAQLELTNSANFPLLLNNTFKTIDKGLTLDVGTSTGTGNDYVLNLGSISLSSANKGISFKFWADKNSTGAVTINGTYNLVKDNGNPIKNIKRNAPYVITYDGGTNFFLASGGVDDVNFSASDLLENKTANNSDGEKVNGTMKNVGQQTATINAGGKVVITKGYHDGTGYIQSNSMSTQLNSLGVTLTGANQLVNGVKAVDKNGNVITGTATIESLGGLVKQEGTFVRSTGSEATVTLGYRPKMVICMLADNNQEFYFDLGQELCSFIPTRVRLIAKSDGRDCYYYWNWTDTDFYGDYGVKITDNGFTHKPVGGYGQSVRYITFR